MKLNDTGLIELDAGSTGPMCPQSMPPLHPAHQLAVMFQDAAYEATPRDQDGEPATPELGAVNDAVSYGPTTENRMRLYRDSVVALAAGYRTVVIEALYFRCQLCGFVLPANRMPLP